MKGWVWEVEDKRQETSHVLERLTFLLLMVMVPQTLLASPHTL